MRFLLSLLAVSCVWSGAAELTDVRRGALKDLNGYFPFEVPGSRDAWPARRTELRLQLQVALGLYPLPMRGALNTVIHGRREMDGYSIEKVYFECFPGFFVTGNLYRPKEVKGRVPGILCPHGHWPNGRFMNETDEGVKKAMESGAEVFASAARSPLQARCVHLARMGCVVFHYDMLGYADSGQISQELAHKFASQKAATPGGFYTAAAEGQLQGILGLQIWQGIRALDFMQSLPDVDAKKLGVTGASGGGTQTFLLGAVDPRPAAAFPAVMVSTAMQGGCTCENASLLRIGTGNVEIAALFAPKPLGMTCADDWTKEMPTKGFPELKRFYEMLGAGEKVSLTALTQFPHNYNHPSRAAMEAWFAKHLLNGAEAPPERDFTFLPAADLTVWDAAHPAPAGGPAAERAVLQEWTKATEQAIREHEPVAGLQGWHVIVGRSLKTTGEAVYEFTGKKAEESNYFRIEGEVQNRTHQEAVKTTFLHPKVWNHKVAIWVSGEGSRGLFAADGVLDKDVARLVAAGWAVAGVDLLFQGEKAVNRRVANPREAPAYTYGYNTPLFIQRIHDLLSVVKMVQTNPDYTTEHIAMCAGKGGGKFAAVASLIAGKAVQACVYETEGFRFADLTDVYDADFVPGAVKYGDLDGITKLLPQKRALDDLVTGK